MLLVILKQKWFENSNYLIKKVTFHLFASQRISLYCENLKKLNKIVWKNIKISKTCIHFSVSSEVSCEVFLYCLNVVDLLNKIVWK